MDKDSLRRIAEAVLTHGASGPPQPQREAPLPGPPRYLHIEGISGGVRITTEAGSEALPLRGDQGDIDRINSRLAELYHPGFMQPVAGFC